MQPWATNPPKGYKVFPVGDAFVYVHETANIYGDVSLGRFSTIGPSSNIGGPYKVKIGSFCSIAPEVYCYTKEGHQTDYVTTAPLQTLLGMDLGYPEVVEKPRGVTIGHDVWLGHQARLMPGITIGDGVIVGARAVVTKDLEPYGVYVGVPARLARKRFSSPVIAALLDIGWWDWPVAKIQRNAAFFSLKLTDIDDPAGIYRAIVD